MRGAAQRSARDLCSTCPVRMAGLVEALESDSEFGIWGGLTEREHRALLRRHPDVTDRAAWLGDHQDEVETPAIRTARLRGARAMAAT